MSARVTTRVLEWLDTDANERVPVDAPDSIAVAGHLLNNAEVSIQVAAVPVSPTGSRLEIYGRQGTLILASGGALSTGPNRLFAVKGQGVGEEMTIPGRYTLVREGTPTEAPRNVAQAYVGAADAWEGKPTAPPDFDLAVTRHRSIEAIERSSREGRSITVPT